jgi:RNA polymerase sigma factor (sigma-70 family)
MTRDSTPSVERLLGESVWLASLARALLGRDEHAVDDVVQEVRLAALNSAPADSGRARAWLVRVTRNLALRTRLRRARRERRERAAADSEALPSTVELVARVHAQRCVAAAVLALEEPYRSVVLSRYFDALSAREVATEQGVPVETIRTRLKRAHAKLREALDEEFGGRVAWVGLLLPWSVPGGGAAATAAAGTGAKAAGATAGTAVVVGAGVAAMSVTTKVVSVAALVVAAAVGWRLVWPSGASPPTSSSLVAAGRAPATADAPEQPSRSSRVDAVATTDASRSPDAAVPSPPPEDPGLHVVATIVRASDGSPVASAALNVRSRCIVGGRWGDEQLESAKSDGAGHVELVLTAAAHRIARWEVVASELAPHGESSINESRAVGRQLDLGTIQLERGALVKGRVLRARDGQALAHAELRLSHGENGYSLLLDRARPEGWSEADGSFTLAERVWHPNRSAAILFAFCDAGIGWAKFNTPAGAEETAGVDVLIEDAAGLSVSVRDDHGVAVPLASVSCVPHFVPMERPSREEARHEILYLEDPDVDRIFNAKSGADGVASFSRLPVGSSARLIDPHERVVDRYSVVASAVGFDVGFVDGVQLGAGTRSSCEVVLHRERSIAILGKVRGLDGQPIPDAKIHASGRDFEVEATSDEAGEYRLDRVLSTRGSMFVRATAEQHVLLQQSFAFDQLVRASSQDDSGAPIEAYSLDLVLERTARIAGRVVDEGGAPITGASLWFNRVKDGVVDGLTFQATPPVTGADGRFEYEATESEWQVTASAPLGDGDAGPATRRRVTGGASDLELSCVTRVAASGATLACEVVDAATDAPVPVASAYLRDADELNWIYTPVKCALGSLTARKLAVGRWRLQIELGDHRVAASDFEVTSDHDVVRLRVAVGAPARVAGRFEFDPSSGVATVDDLRKRRILVWWQPLEPHPVDASGKAIVDDRYSGCTPPDDDGRFFLDGFVPGKTAIVYTSDWEQLYDEAVFTPTSGEVREVVFRLAPSAKMVIERVDDFSAGYLCVDIALADGPLHREFWMDRMKRADRDWPKSIRPGRHRWRALYLERPSDDGVIPRVRSASGEFDVAAGETYVLRLAGLR